MSAAQRFLTEPLASQHSRQGFSCSVESLDRYFQRQAGQDTRRGLAVVYVLPDRASGTVIGYYTLSNYLLLPSNLPEKEVRQLPRYDGFPAILLGRLAVNQQFQGQGFGGLLLLDGLQRCLAASQQVAAMAVVVHAISDSARAFYERFGFKRFADHELALYLPMAEIARL